MKVIDPSMLDHVSGAGNFGDNRDGGGRVNNNGGSNRGHDSGRDAAQAAAAAAGGVIGALVTGPGHP
ncbi:hypothetical protein ACF0H2_03100 [Serratia marcescens]